ncbi:MAG TPA: TraB/GumN family protein, partial [Arenimonas sp.]|nr:TraB/GumN family protein [Arenimonas sp.]
MRLAWTACLLALTVAAGCARAEAPRPLLWKVSDADNSVYLLGSFHLLRKGDYPLAASTDLAFEDAESLVFELSPAEMNDPALGQLMATAARRDDGKRLQDTVSADTWARLEAWAQRRGLPLENLQGLDAWFVGLTISLMEMQALGLDP